MFRTISALAFVVAAFLLPSSATAQTPTPQTRLWDAAIAGDTAALAAALGAGAAIDSLDVRRNPNGRRALNWSAWYDRVTAIQFLLTHGAQLEARNRTGFTALHHAAESGSIEALETLLAAGADPTAPNGLGVTPLETARQKGQTKAAAILEAAIRQP